MRITQQRALWYILATIGIAACGSKKPAEKPVAFGDIGLDRSIIFLAADPDARWVAYCQARDTEEVWYGYHGEVFGSELDVYITEGAGPGRKVDDFFGADATGRYVALLEGGHVVLHDVVTGARDDLTAGGAVAVGDSRFAIPVSFDDDGNMLYVRERDGRTEIVVRDLASGTERGIEPQDGVLAGAMLAPSGSTVMYAVVDTDTDGDGSLDAPTVHTNLAPRRCRGVALSMSTHGFSGDKPRVIEVSLGGGPPDADREEPADDDNDSCGPTNPRACGVDADGRRPVAVTRDGRWLVVTRDGNKRRASRGPLRWIAPPTALPAP